MPRTSVTTWLVLLGVSLALGVGGLLPAGAHEGEEEDLSAADLVRQAIALMVNAPEGTEEIADKIADAGEAEDAGGVDLSLVEQAGTVFAEGDLHQARALLERSIGARPHLGEPEPPPIRETTPTDMAPTGSGMGMAMGSEPGSELVADPLDARPRLSSADWVLIAGSIVVGLAGVGLGARWRPRHGRTA